MSKTNKEVVKGFLEEIINAKRFDRLYEFYNPDSILHSTPYVGVEIVTDDSLPE